MRFTGFLPTNIGIPSQFGTNAYLTNKGSSNYHGLLVTLDKNISQGLRFEFNYTWSHSIDNASVGANENALFTNTGLICDILQPRACRASSDFDVRQEITSNFEYDLPFGRGKMFAGERHRAGSTRRLADGAFPAFPATAPACPLPCTPTRTWPRLTATIRPYSPAIRPI